jgi:predicted NBD/HSP70 family sugar kinase
VTRKGLNMENLKKRNRRIILETIEQMGPMSRKDLSTKLNLTPAALTLITTEMLKEDILYEVGEIAEKRVGRKKILIDIDYNSRYVIGVNIEKNEAIIALTNLKGDIVKLVEFPKLKRKDHLENYSEKIYEIIKEKKINIENIVGIGIGIYGYVNPNEGIVSISGEEFDILEYFRNRFNLKVVIDNNVRALALSETFFNKELRYFLFVKYGPGIGSSIVFEKEILYGNNYYAGEIGHIIVNKEGVKCNICNKTGCLENYVNFEKIIAKITESVKAHPDSSLTQIFKSNNEITMKNILIAAENSEKFVIDEIKEVASLISKAILNLLTVMDFEKIVFYGDIFNNKLVRDIFVERLEYYDSNFDRDKLEISKNKHFPKNLGGVFLAIKEIFYTNGGAKE